MNTVLRTVRNIAIATVSLAVVIVGGGVGYAWYSGQHAEDNAAAFAKPGESFKQETIEPVKVSQTGRLGVSVQMLTSPVAPGSNASMMVRTNPLANCLITVEYANKSQSKDSGLVQKKADEYGIVEWTWTVEPSVPLGTSPVTVTCANQKNSAVVEADLIVAKTQD